MSIYWLEQRVEDVPEDDRWLLPNELVRLESLKFPKRRADWRLGRWTAKSAAAAYLKLTSEPISQNYVEIRTASSGAPEVFIRNQPASVSISLSHCRATAACVVGPGGAILGCDLEFIEPRGAGFVGDYFTKVEQEYVARAAKGDHDKVVTLIWSAKESALKAMRTGLRLDTRSVSVELGDGFWDALNQEIDPKSSTSSSTPLPPQARWSPMRVSHGSEQVFDGWWHCNGRLARTVVSIPSSEPPSIFKITS